MASKRDYYDILGVRKESDDEEIKKAYRKLAMEFHPDRNVGDAEAETKFKEAAEAYEVLRDQNKRQRYDRYGHAGLDGMNVPHFNDAQSVFDIFGDIFGDMFGQRRTRSGPRPGADLRVDVQLDLIGAYRGASKTIQVRREENCPECSGSGCRKGTKPTTCRRCQGQGAVLMSQGFFRIQQTCSGCGGRGVVISDPCLTCHGHARVQVARSIDITIPAGVDTGNRLRVAGEGEAGDAGAPRGDLWCVIHVADHSLFQRDGSHLICQVPITFSQAALGGEIEVPTLDGRETHTLKRGIQSGEVVRIHGKGMPTVDRNGRSGRPGDLIVQVFVETPKQMTKRQEELLRELAELDHKNVSPQRKSFLEKLKDLFAPAAEPNESKPANGGAA